MPTIEDHLNVADLRELRSPAGDEAIPLERLRAVPWARYCAAHQAEWEAGQRAATAKPRRSARPSFARG